MEYDMKLILDKTYGKGEKILLETERLILRELTYDDFKPLYAVLGDSDIMKHYPYTFDENKVRNWIGRNIERYRTDGFGLWAVVLKENGEMIGDCGITMQNINSQLLPEIGYHIRKDMQNKGYATEAAAGCIRYGFEKLNFDCLYSYMKYTNSASARVAEKNGMKFIGEYPDEVNYLTRVYCVNRKEWKMSTIKNYEERRKMDKMRNDITIRPETTKDYKEIISLILRSFSEGTNYSDGSDIVALIEEIRMSEYYIPELSFVAELDGKIVGHFLFSHFPLSETKEGGHINDNSIVMLAPVSVHADYFHQHIGISMLKLGIEKVKEHGFKGINVEGDYHFYNRVGFRTSSEYGIYPTSGIPMQEPRCMMCMETSEGSLENIGGYVVYDMYYNA